MVGDHFVIRYMFSAAYDGDISDLSFILLLQPLHDFKNIKPK